MSHSISEEGLIEETRIETIGLNIGRRASSIFAPNHFRRKKKDSKDSCRNKINFKQDFIKFTACEERPSAASYLVVFISFIIVFSTFPLSLIFCVKVVQEYERAVIFRLGRLRKGGAKVKNYNLELNFTFHLMKGPGIFFIVPCVDSYQCVDLRTVSFDVPPQEVVLDAR